MTWVGSTLEHPLALWGGVAAGFRRIGDVYLDDLSVIRHPAGDGDFDRLLSLGVRTVRVPVSWERTVSRVGAEPDFTFADQALHRLRNLGVEVIVELVHDGTGLGDAHVLSHSFAGELATFARRVAERYPWVETYTPIHAPLATARAGALDGSVYPHHRTEASFARALINEVRATIMAMRAICEVRGATRLLQSEMIGRTFASPKLRRHAEFENERRWLGLDLLFGHVSEDHILFEWLTDECGIASGELAAIMELACPPSMIGVEYRASSDRMLDERAERYPAEYRTRIDDQVFADVAAYRARSSGMVGHRRTLEVVHLRYGVPTCLVDVHLGGTESEEAAWLLDAWNGALSAREAGVSVTSVMLGAAFGHVAWAHGGGRRSRRYEAGAFDVRDGTVRATALARTARLLARGGVHELDDDAFESPSRVSLTAVGADDSVRASRAG